MFSPLSMGLSIGQMLIFMEVNLVDMGQQIIELQQQIKDLKTFNSKLLLLTVSSFVMAHNSEIDSELKMVALEQLKNIIEQDGILLGLGMKDSEWALLERLIPKLHVQSE